MSSVSDERTIVRYGYSFFPHAFSLSAYSYLLRQVSTIGLGYFISIATTAVGTVVGTFLMAMFAYPLSRTELRFRRPLSLFVFFAVLFNGGLVPTYLLYTQVLHIKNTVFALLVPGLLMNGYSILLMRAFMASSIPVPIIESVRLDGAGEFRILFSMVFPLSQPILATVGLFQAIAYWNDWFNGLIYLTEPKLFSIQVILNRIMSDIQFLNSSSLASRVSAASSIPSITVRMAIAVVAVVPILVAYPFFQKYFVKGIAAGAIKA